MKYGVDDYVTTGRLVEWAMDKIDICKPREEFDDHDIAEIMQWIGICAADTFVTQDGFPFIRRMGIGLMLTVTLLEFPEYFMKYELAQFN